MQLPRFGKPFHLALLSLITLLVAVILSYMAQLTVLTKPVDEVAWNYWDWAYYAPIVADSLQTIPRLTSLSLHEVSQQHSILMAQALLQITKQLPESAQESYWILELKQRSYQQLGNEQVAEQLKQLQQVLFPEL